MAAGENRTPPHSDEAEQSVLGALLVDERAFEAVGPVLSPSDFYHPDHRAIFNTIGSLVAVGKAVDVLTVREAGGHDLAYLNGLAASVPGWRHAGRHATIVREHAVRRTVMALAMDLRDAMFEDGGQEVVAQAIDSACAGLLDLQGAGAAREPTALADLLPPWIDALNDRDAGKTDAISTGLEDVDRVLAGGPRPGELWVIGARPSMGKSALAMTMARKVAPSHAVLMLSMEDSDQMLVSRQVAAAGRVNLADIRNPQRALPAVRDRMWSGVAQAVDDLKALRLYVDDSPALTLADVRTKVLQAKRKAGELHMVMVDYIQLMEGDGETRAQELTKVARGLKRLAKDLRCVVVVMAQLSRKADETNAPPRLDHLAESGGIEQAADIICLLWREARRNPKPENKHTAQIEFVKNKNGPTDTVRLWFDGATQRFESVVEDSHG